MLGLLESLLAKTTTNSKGCLLWTGAHMSGYPVFWYPREKGEPRRYLLLTVAVWEEKNGPVPEGQVIKHSCDERACINLDHLHAGTRASNNQEAWDRLRPRKLTEEEIAHIKASPGVSGRSLATKFGVAIHDIWNVRSGHTGKSVSAKKLNHNEGTTNGC